MFHARGGETYQPLLAVQYIHQQLDYSENFISQFSPLFTAANKQRPLEPPARHREFDPSSILAQILIALILVMTEWLGRSIVI